MSCIGTYQLIYSAHLPPTVAAFCAPLSILHGAADPKIGQATGFGGVILHGLSSFGFAARAIVSAVAGGDPNALRLFGLRFSSPVKPGDELETSIWEVGPGPDGTTELAFETKDVQSGKVCLSNGIAYVKKAEKGKL